MYMFSNTYANPSWWTEIIMEQYGLGNVCFQTSIQIHAAGGPKKTTTVLKNVYAFKQLSESGLVDRNKNRTIWFYKCICVQTSIRI